MKECFHNARIALLGASNFQRGRTVHYLRAHFEGRADRPFFYNRALGGNTAGMVEVLLPDEILSLRPDYCFIQYGANDLGVWLYDTAEEVTPALLEARSERDRAYLASTRRNLRLLKEAGITPILCTVIAFNERLSEDEEIETLADNREKGEKIKSTLYTNEAFLEINRTLSRYREALLAIAHEEGIPSCDLFTPFLRAQYEREGLYEADGIHLTEEGQRLLAGILLAHLGEEGPAATEGSEALKELFTLEERERQVQYVRWAFYHPIFGPVREEKIREEMEAMCRNEAEPPHRRAAARIFLENGGSAEALRQRIEELYR